MQIQDASLHRAPRTAPGVQPSAAGSSPAPEYVPDQILVKFAPKTSASMVSNLAATQGLQPVRHFAMPETMQQSFGGELYQFKLAKGETVEQAIKRLSSKPGVLYAEPNYKITINDPKPTAAPTAGAPTPQEGSLPNDLDSRLWGLKNDGQDGGTAGKDIGAAEAWKTTTGKPNGQGPLIVVIDTGIDYNHDDLKANVWTNPGEIPGNGIDDDGNGVIDDVHGANFAADNGNPLDDQGHGTHCAGTIGAVGNNGQGVVGVNWDATIAGAKFLDASGSGTYADALEAVLYAEKIGARVTSNSWGGGGFSQALYDAFKASHALHIAAAGNNGSNSDTSPSYPAAFDLDNMVSVAAVDRNGHLADFSNYGATSVDVAAPGVDVYSLAPNNAFETMSGTSMATPHVAGVAGLILAQFPDLSNAELKARLINTSTKEAELSGKMIGGGIVNATNALEEDSIAPATPTDFRTTVAGATSVQVGWSAVGDDGNEGVASTYEVRYADRPITAEGSNGSVAWEHARVAASLQGTAEAGAAMTANIDVSPSTSPQTLYVAMKAFDNLGNPSGMVTAEATTQPAAFALNESFEAGSQGWDTTGTWGLVQDGTHGAVFTDSPNGLAAGDSKAYIRSKALDLTHIAKPRLVFDTKVDTEAGFDFLKVEISDTTERAWTQLATYTGTSDWSEKSLDLSAYAGKSVKLRFSYISDGSVSRDGVFVDNIRVAGEPA